MSVSEDLIQKLKTQAIDAEIVDYKSRGYHVEVFPAKDKIREFANVMLELEFYLDFVTAVHVENALQVVYQFGHFTESCHVNAKSITENGKVKTISDIFHGANWHERETKDFYGLDFEDHPDMRVLILDEEDFDLNPLLKSEKKLQPLEGVTRKNQSEEKSEKKAAKVKDKEES